MTEFLEVCFSWSLEDELCKDDGNGVCLRVRGVKRAGRKRASVARGQAAAEPRRSLQRPNGTGRHRVQNASGAPVRFPVDADDLGA